MTTQEFASQNTYRLPVATMSAFDLAHWRLNELLYIRPLPSAAGDGVAVYAADGTFLFTAESVATVVLTAAFHEMELATVH